MLLSNADIFFWKVLVKKCTFIPHQLFSAFCQNALLVFVIQESDIYCSLLIYHTIFSFHFSSSTSPFYCNIIFDLKFILYKMFHFQWFFPILWKLIEPEIISSCYVFQVNELIFHLFCLSKNMLHSFIICLIFNFQVILTHFILNVFAMVTHAPLFLIFVLYYLFSNSISSPIVFFYCWNRWAKFSYVYVFPITLSLGWKYIFHFWFDDKM